MTRNIRDKYVVDYDYRDGGSFVRNFRTKSEAVALCVELMQTQSICWVQGQVRGERFFPGPGTQRAK